MLVAGCAGGAVHRAQPASRAAPTSAAPVSVIPRSGAPAKSPSKPQKASSPDSLGARRVIPVPKAVALQQQHRLLAVDGQATLLDAAPGIYPRPLLLVLHGMGESALTMRQQTGFTALAALDGFDVAYPDAPEDPAITTSAAVFVRPQSVVADPSTAGAATTASTPTPTAAPSAASPTPTRTPTPTPNATPTPTKSPNKTPAPSQSHKPTPPPRPSPSATPTPKKRPSPLVAGRRAWNAGICCALALRNDVGYLVNVVNAVSQAVPVDATRVYVVGFSNGGMMALQAICQRLTFSPQRARWPARSSAPPAPGRYGVTSPRRPTRSCRCSAAFRMRRRSSEWYATGGLHLAGDHHRTGSLRSFRQRLHLPHRRPHLADTDERQLGLRPGARPLGLREPLPPLTGGKRCALPGDAGRAYAMWRSSVSSMDPGSQQSLASATIC